MDTQTWSSKGNEYALINYYEVISYWQQPFYQRWFKSPPKKVLMEINTNK